MGKKSHHCHKVTKGMTSVTEMVRSQCHSHMMSNMRTVGGKVHNYNSSCIYSIENQMGTLLSSPCQLGLGG